MGRLNQDGRCQAFHFKGGQGAKTGTGGHHLPGEKVKGKIAQVRGLKEGEPAVPVRHRCCSAITFPFPRFRRGRVVMPISTSSIGKISPPGRKIWPTSPASSTAVWWGGFKLLRID